MRRRKPPLSGATCSTAAEKVEAVTERSSRCCKGCWSLRYRYCNSRQHREQHRHCNACADAAVAAEWAERLLAVRKQRLTRDQLLSVRRAARGDKISASSFALTRILGLQRACTWRPTGHGATPYTLFAAALRADPDQAYAQRQHRLAAR